MSDLSRVEQLLRNALGEDIYEVTPQSRVEILLAQLNELIEGISASVDPEELTPIVTAWLAENIHDGAVVDTSLSISGAAADAKETGDKYAQLKEDLSDVKSDIRGIAERSANLNSDAFIYKKSGAIPSYYFDSDSNPNSFDKQQYLEECIARVPDGKHFIFYSDVHWTVNRKNSTPLIQYVRSRLGIEKVLNAGDILNSDDNKYLASSTMASYINEVASAVGANIFVAMGDHDNNTVNYTGDDLPSVMLPFKQIEKWLMTPIKDIVQRESVEDLEERFSNVSGITSAQIEELVAYMRLHFYFDDVQQKIRYIVLTSGTSKNGVITDLFDLAGIKETYMEIPWLGNTLLSVPEDYDVVIMMHNSIDYYDDRNAVSYVGTPSQIIHRILSARKAKTTYTRSLNAGNTAFIDAFPELSDGISFDFSVATSLDNAIVLGGDTHLNLDGIAVHSSTSLKEYSGRTITAADVLSVVIQTDCSHQHNSYIDHDSMGEASRMTDNTITEQAFDVVTIGENNLITFTRFGAGIDRVFDMSI